MLLFNVTASKMINTTVKYKRNSYIRSINRMPEKMFEHQLFKVSGKQYRKSVSFITWVDINERAWNWKYLLASLVRAAFPYDSIGVRLANISSSLLSLLALQVWQLARRSSFAVALARIFQWLLVSSLKPHRSSIVVKDLLKKLQKLEI